MVPEIVFLVMSWLMASKDNPCGKISDNKARPTVVATTRVFFTKSAPFSMRVHSDRRTLTLACRSTLRLS